MDSESTSASSPVLGDLGLRPSEVVGLSSRDRRRLLSFLLRWNRAESLHACLDAIEPAQGRRVSLLDLRARAFLGQNRPTEALAVMEERLDLRTSSTAHALLARVHLARGDSFSAFQIANDIVERHQGRATGWHLLGEVELARGDTGSAFTAYQRLRSLIPHSRAYLLGMVELHRTLGSWVTASAYAVRLLRSAVGQWPLSVYDLQRLRDYFQTSGEETRIDDLTEELERRYTSELAALRESLSVTAQSGAAPIQLPPLPERTVSPLQEPVPVLDRVDITEEEKETILESAGRLFGFKTLLPGQLETIACALRSEDVLTILPTGGGKSLCYQLPALLSEQGTTLVVSPLISLMKDQVDSLPASQQDRATTINSSLERDDLRRRLRDVAAGAYRLVYAAPERLRQPTFLHALRRARPNWLVVDEAHCVSMWGHDFRPDYLTIGKARQSLGNPPLLAMTATAPPRVRRDILRQLGDMRVIAGDLTRLNLRLQVLKARDTDEKLRYLLSFCCSQSGSGIVYAGTRARCEELAALLRRHGISADHYHAGIADRARVQDAFMQSRVRVVVATIAFGLGIDKADIRFIVHFVPPSSLEAYYQEAGRAGRDGLPARCLLMYSASDRATLSRRARRDLLPAESLYSVYEAVRRSLGDLPAGRVAAADLERNLRIDDTCLRVTLSMLEEVGMLRRGPDVPRAAMVRLNRSDLLESMPQLAAFCCAARLRPGQRLRMDLADVARQIAIPLHEIETQVLHWSDAGWLTYSPAGRDLLLEVLPKPVDAAERIQSLLERQEVVAGQRIDEISAYAGTHRCRHGHLNAYLGGRTITRCDACDNCVEIQSPPEVVLPSEREQLLSILECIAAVPWSCSQRTLTHILRGDNRGLPRRRRLHPRGHDQAGFGILAFRSETAIRALLDRLRKGRFLRTRRHDNDGVVIDLTGTGRAALEDPAALDSLTNRPRKPMAQRVPYSAEDHDLVADEPLFEILRVWRLEEARVQGIPAFVIFHNSHLRDMAAHRPLTLDALSRLRGVGPKKLEKYGTAIVELVRRHLEEQAG